MSGYSPEPLGVALTSLVRLTATAVAQADAMLYVVSFETLEDGRRRQALLADMAETEEVRRVHEALEQLYRTQLVATEVSMRLASLIRTGGSPAPLDAQWGSASAGAR